jgi:large subunit ribosomal protein L31
MKADIHPKYIETKVICACGETFLTHSTKPEIKVEVCSACHPFYTGQQKMIDSEGRVDRFIRRYNLQDRYKKSAKALKAEKAAAEAAAAPAGQSAAPVAAPAEQ